MLHRKNAFLAVRVLLIIALLLASLLCFRSNIQNVKAESSFNDEFKVAAIDSSWSTIDPGGGSTFNLTANPGWLRITTSSPPVRDLYKPVAINAPRIMLTGKTGDFTIETEVMATADQEWESAGILVWKDASNFLRLDRACGISNSQRIVFIMARNDGWDPIDVVLSSNINPTYLKITKTVDKFTAFYSSNGADWIKVGEKTFSVSDPLDVGLDVVNVYHDGLFFADFDFFRVISTPSVTTTLDISCKSSTSYSGFNVEIKGRLVFNGISLPNAPILISYSVTGGKSWEDLTLVNTGSDGRYSASWLPSVTGNYLVKATCEGDAGYPGTSKIVNFAVTQFAEKNVFSVSSDSTVSSLAFNSESRVLSFTVTGESGTTGYVDMYVATSVIGDITGVKAYLDGVEIGYSATAVNDSWLFHFSYQHSTHAVLVSLGPSPSVFSLDSPLGIGIIIGIILIVIVAGVLVALRKRKTSQDK